MRAKRYLGLLPGGLPSNPRAWSDGSFLTAFEISLYVNKALTKRADKVSEIEFILKDKKDDEIEDDPLLELLKKPNPAFTGAEFWGLAQNYYDIFGEVYILKDNSAKPFEREIFDDDGNKPSKVKALYLLFPHEMTPHFDGFGNPQKYVKKSGNGEVEYKPEQIIYIRRPNPRQPLRGMSLLKAGVMAIQTETQISAYHSRILENGGKVEGVFKFKTPSLTEAQLKDLKDQYAKEYADARKAGRPIFLGGDGEYVNTGLTPTELSYMEAKKTSLQDICILTSVPQSMLASTNDVKFDNAEADRSIFLRETILPLLKMYTTALDYGMFPQDQTLEPVDPTPENVDRELKKAESGMKNYYMTINEVRKMRGLDPLPDGDVIMVPFNLTALGEEVETTPPPEEKRLKGSGDSAHPNSDPDIREAWGKMQDKRMQNREKKGRNIARSYFNEQRDRLIEAVGPAKARTFRRKDLLEEAMQIELEVKIGKEKFLPFLEETLKEAGQDGLTLAGSDYSFNYGATQRSWLENRSDVFLRQVNETTFNSLKDAFAESLEAGENRDQLIKRIKETYTGITKARATTIARTEVHNSTQYGTIEGYKQAGLNTKIWVTVGDSNVRHSHASVDGEEVPIDAAFSNGLMFPGDPNGSAAEVINCRCTI